MFQNEKSAVLTLRLLWLICLTGFYFELLAVTHLLKLKYFDSYFLNISEYQALNFATSYRLMMGKTFQKQKC